MRYATLILAMSGGLAAQSPYWQRPNLPQYFHQYKFPVTPSPAPKMTLVPGQKCSIPLVNALKKDETNDKMVFHVPPAKSANTGIVAPPAPSCDDVR